VISPYNEYEPMPHQQFSRRAFLQSGSVLAKGSFIVLAAPAILAACRQADESMQADTTAFNTLSAREAGDLRAIVARIIPSDDTTGAEEAGVIYFIDAVLGDNRDEQYRAVQAGLREIQETAASRYTAANFADLSVAQQDELLADRESTPFFATIRYLTIAGMFSLPSYGGNRDKAGYAVIGFDDQHAWAPPFGFYDADYATRGE
jgi:gluconate 2-dehydrogenase gamma chain